MNQKSTAQRAQIVRCLLEGCSIRSTVRMTGAAKNTVIKLQVELGQACMRFHDATVRDVKSLEVQCDEIWSFVGMKEKNIPEEKIGLFGYGDVWTWTAIDADSKLMISYMVGMRDAQSALDFLSDVKGRLANRVQLTSDGHKVYLKAVREVFGKDIDYAMLVKHYGNDYEGEKRYSPAVCTGCEKTPVIGNPDLKKVNTSFVERANLSIRMQNRRFTRLTNAFSKKLANHEAAMSLYFVFYNFARPHQTLTKGAGFPTTPAMAAGKADHVWTIEELVGLLSN